ncbi:MAG: type II secretion system F family protein [Actinomycetota bacterium]|nr:type II secretion system F family protein [Actinomycetota bacterium]
MATATFTYRVRTRDGRVVNGSMEGDSNASVAQRLRSQNMVPLEIKQESTAGLKMEFKLPQRVKLKDLAVFSRQFATMIASGLSLLRALNILSEQTENKKLAETVALVRDDVEGGTSLSASMAKYPKVFAQLFVSLVRAGETGGQLDTVLVRIADGYEKDYRLRQKIKSAMTYPVVVFMIAIVLVSIMLIFIVPTFAAMFVNLGGELPLPTKILLFLSQKAIILLPLAAILGVTSFVLYKRFRKSSVAFALRADAVKLKIPVFGDLFSKIALARFSRTLSLLMRSGVPVLQALEITAEATGNFVIGAAATDVRTSVREGESISAPLKNHKVFPPMVVQMIAVGEDTGQVDDMLDKIADFYEQEVESTTESLTALLEPLMIAVLGGLVGSMVIALYMPMFKVFDLIK